MYLAVSADFFAVAVHKVVVPLFAVRVAPLAETSSPVLTEVEDGGVHVIYLSAARVTVNDFPSKLVVKLYAPATVTLPKR